MGVAPAFECLHAQLQRGVEAWSDERAAHAPASAAVLMALSEGDDPDLLFTERSADMRKHAGQISFPGGRRDAGDADEFATAVREANEEVGFQGEWARLLGYLPVTRIPVTSFDVTPVVVTWAGTQELHIASPDEVAAIHRWPISVLSEPQHRVLSVHPSGHEGPAWILDDVFLWGFSAYLTDALLSLGGWNRPWTPRRVPVPRRFLRD